VIQRVEYFPSEFESPALIDSNLLEQTGIEIREPGASENVAARGAERS